MNPAPCTWCQRPIDPPKRRRVHAELCRRCAYRLAHARYRKSEQGRAKGAAALARYRRTEKGRAAMVRHQARYRQSEQGRAKEERYRQSDTSRAWWTRYRETVEGRATIAKACARRRARAWNATVLEAVDRRVIFTLDGGLCHLCDLSVDLGAFHVDHIIPLAVEPIHAEFNSAVAHPTCNSRKRARFIALSPTARARWQEQRPEHLALLDAHVARLAA